MTTCTNCGAPIGNRYDCAYCHSPLAARGVIEFEPDWVEIVRDQDGPDRPVVSIERRSGVAVRGRVLGRIRSFPEVC